jgi:hypothetical protein
VGAEARARRCCGTPPPPRRSRSTSLTHPPLQPLHLTDSPPTPHVCTRRGGGGFQRERLAPLAAQAQPAPGPHQHSHRKGGRRLPLRQPARVRHSTAARAVSLVVLGFVPGGERSHAAVSRRRSVSLSRSIARTEGYTHDAKVGAFSSVQGAFSVAPCQTLASVTIRNVCVAGETGRG